MIMVLMDRYCLPEECFFKQMVAWVGKVGGNFTRLFIRYGVLKFLDGKQLTANDPLSSGAYVLKRCRLNGRRQELNQTLMGELGCF